MRRHVVIQRNWRSSGIGEHAELWSASRRRAGFPRCAPYSSEVSVFSAELRLFSEVLSPLSVEFVTDCTALIA
jgi:hypothetical protein